MHTPFAASCLMKGLFCEAAVESVMVNGVCREALPLWSAVARERARDEMQENDIDKMMRRRPNSAWRRAPQLQTSGKTRVWTIRTETCDRPPALPRAELRQLRPPRSNATFRSFHVRSTFAPTLP